jgi:hypothetical protein
MSENYDYKELFSQYAVEAGRYLPRRKREDIQFEILSLLEDSLEDKSARDGKEPNEAMVIEVLKELGPPITFAENYRENDGLVSPAVFPIFRSVLIFAAAVFLLQFLIGVFLPIGKNGFDILTIIVNFFDQAFQLFGVLVFAFAMLERTTPKSWLRWPFEEMNRTWDPTGLKPEKRKSAVKPGELWFEIVFLVGLVVLFAVFPQWVGFGNNRNGVWNFVPVLSTSFSVYLPWLVAYYLAKIIFNASLARQSFWDTRMRWLAVALKGYAIVLLIAFLTGPDVFGLNPAYLAAHNPTKEVVDWFTANVGYFNTGFRVYLIINLIVQPIVLIKMVFSIIKGKDKVELRIE